MQLSKALRQWKERPLNQWVAIGNRTLPQTLSAVLVIAIAYQAARVTWLAIPGAGSDAPLPTLAPATTSSAATPAAGPDISSIVDAHLFGEASATPAPVVVESLVDAPDTTLSLSLTGILSSESSEYGGAIISASRGEEKTYFVGDTIESTGGATLHAVYGNRVILNRAGRLETLRLPKELTSGPAARMTPQRPVVGQSDNSIREIISDNAQRLSQVIRVAPYIDQGQMVGFRLNPGSERDVFESLGLQPNDVVTDINGMALTDPSSSLQVFQSLGEATMANVTIIRNGTPEVLVIDTTQLQQLSEGRQ